MTDAHHDKIIVAVSGGFDPLHPGHVRMFIEAKRFGDELVVILNNDNWLTKKKGYVFMPQEQRKEIIEALKPVDRVVISSHESDPSDMSVAGDLQALRPTIFANGGDRGEHNTPEMDVCAEIACQMVFSVGAGGKVESSSWLLGKFAEYIKNK